MGPRQKTSRFPCVVPRNGGQEGGSFALSHKSAESDGYVSTLSSVPMLPCF